MGKRKFRIELEDAEGSKYNLSLEGNISKEKILKIVEFMDLLNIEEGGNGNGASLPTARLGAAAGDNENDSNKPTGAGDRIWALVADKFPFGSFTSSDILELYEDTYNEPIKLSIISTYLSRYAERGRLVRARQGKEWVYKATTAARQQPAGSRLLAADGEKQQQQPSRPAAADRLL
ncbi:MAG: hypothetical protein AB1753_05780 [Thermoproteota archaeon]